MVYGVYMSTMARRGRKYATSAQQPPPGTPSITASAEQRHKNKNSLVG